MFPNVKHCLCYFSSFIVSLPNEHFVENSAQRPDVCLRAILILDEHFRRHVGGRANDVGKR